MASGKSLELAKIGRKPGSWRCICGEAYIDHMKKDGSAPLAKYSDQEKHRPITGQGYNRTALRRYMREQRNG
jgi:hypothetical protein